MSWAAPAAWRRALGYVESHFAVAGGFGFTAGPTGLWLEGTAQAALEDVCTGGNPREASLADIVGIYQAAW